MRTIGGCAIAIVMTLAASAAEACHVPPSIRFDERAETVTVTVTSVAYDVYETPEDNLGAWRAIGRVEGQRPPWLDRSEIELAGAELILTSCGPNRPRPEVDSRWTLIFAISKDGKIRLFDRQPAQQPNP